MCLSCEDIARQICVMLPRWRISRNFLRPVFSASRVQHVSDLHSKFALRLHHVWKYGIDIQSATGEIRRGKRKELECGPMPNMMAALPNIGGALCSTPQSLTDAHY